MTNNTLWWKKKYFEAEGRRTIFTKIKLTRTQIMDVWNCSWLMLLIPRCQLLDHMLGFVFTKSNSNLRLWQACNCHQKLSNWTKNGIPREGIRSGYFVYLDSLMKRNIINTTYRTIIYAFRPIQPLQYA